MKFFQKYYKPRSLTWWSAIIPLAMGLTAATAPLHGLSAVTASINLMTGNLDPYILINSGLFGIGIRGAV